MGVSLTIADVEEIKADLIEEKSSFQLGNQSTLREYGIDSSKLGKSTTTISKNETITRFDRESFHEFGVKMSSETIRKPIYIYEEGAKTTKNKYQEIDRFKFWLDSNYNRIFVFAPKATAKSFLNRLKMSNFLKFTKVEFDFHNLGIVDNIEEPWGFWKDSEGKINRVANFGQGLHEVLEEEDYEDITSFHVDYNYDSEIIQVIISRDGRLSSNSKITSEDLYLIFEDISGALVK